jgi:hypothetical protein
MQRTVLAAAFTIAAVPFSGLVAVTVRYATDDAKHEFPHWYYWVLAVASLLVTGLFLACAARAVGYGPSWSTLFRVTAIALLPIALVSAGSLELPAGLVVLVVAIWALRRRDEPSAGPRRRTSRDSA